MLLRSLPVGLGLLFAFHPATARADDWNGLKSSISSAGDMNGDGFPDLLVTSRYVLPPHFVWILSGKDGSVIRTIRGRTSGYKNPISTMECGDLDGDRRPEPMISVFHGDLSSVTHGDPSEDSIPSPESTRPELYSVSIYSGTTGDLRFDLPRALYALGMADVDGDRDQEIVVCSTPSSPEEPRRVRIHSGEDGRLLYEIEAPRSPRAERFGTSFANLGDLDGDGCDDFALGSPDHWEPKSPGHVYSYSGRNGTLHSAVRGDAGQDGFGSSLSRIDDVDGDGHADLLVGAIHRSVDVLSGKDLRLLHRLDSKNRYAIYDAFSSSLDDLGDVDGDCVPDFVVGANEVAVAFDEGYAWLVSGRTGRVLRQLVQSNEDGADVCGAGDVDGDGVPDVAIATMGKHCSYWFQFQGTGPVLQANSIRVLSGRSWEELWRVNVVDLGARTIEGKEKR